MSEPNWANGANDLDACPQTRRDNQAHAWQFDGDDPYVLCAWCGERRDALTGRTIGESAPAPTPDPMSDDRRADLRFLAGTKFHNAIGDPISELLAEVDHQRAEVERLRAAPCPHVATSGTTSHCILAEEDGRRWRHLSDDVLRIAAQLHRVGQHPAAIELEERVALHRVPSPMEEQDAECSGETEGVVAQQESAPATAGTSAGSSPAHPHPDGRTIYDWEQLTGMANVLRDERDRLRSESDGLRAQVADAHCEVNRENWRVMEAEAALSQLRATVLDQADSIAGRPLTRAEADLCARTLRTAAGQEASDR